MVTIIKTEFMKLKRYFIVWIGVSLMLLTVLLTLFTTMADDGMVWDYQFLFEQVVKHFVTMIFPMCITLISGYMISREYTDDTLKNIETLPISFRKLLAGKLIVSAILSLFLGIVCFVFTVIANFIMGYDGFALIPALTGLVQMALLGFFLYLTMLPIIVLTSRYKGSFLVGVIVAFVYGFIGMFANGTLQSIYPVSAALGLINYRAGAEGVMWNKGLCFISILIMCAIGIALMFDVMILLIGTFIDVSPAILLLTPIMLPVMQNYGFSTLQFGAMMITGLAIGLVTPPVGMCLNACNKINRMPVVEIFKGALPYVICNIIVLVAISLWAPLTTWLPSLLGYTI